MSCHDSLTLLLAVSSLIRTVLEQCNWSPTSKLCLFFCFIFRFEKCNVPFITFGYSLTGFGCKEIAGVHTFNFICETKFTFFNSREPVGC